MHYGVDVIAWLGFTSEIPLPTIFVLYLNWNVFLFLFFIFIFA